MIRYDRVIPRDFFNEAKLLKCFGQLSLKVLDAMTPEGMNIVIEDSGRPFDIRLMEEGSLTIVNYPVKINDMLVRFKTLYNSKRSYPFYCEINGEEYEVFDDDGNFTDEFKNMPL